MYAMAMFAVKGLGLESALMTASHFTATRKLEEQLTLLCAAVRLEQSGTQPEHFVCVMFQESRLETLWLFVQQKKLLGNSMERTCIMSGMTALEQTKLLEQLMTLSAARALSAGRQV